MTVEAGVEPTRLQTFFITFGVQYPREPHPRAVWAHKDGWLEVLAPNENEARLMAYEVLGNAWSFIYDQFTFRSHLHQLGPLARLYPSRDPMEAVAAQEAHEDGTAAAIITPERSMVLHVLTKCPWMEPVPLSELEG